MQDQSRPQSKQKKSRSMLSTNHMSCNKSYDTNFYKQNRINNSALLPYSEIPYQKTAPHWNQSAATWRNTSHKYSFPKDTRFKGYRVEYSDIIQPEIPATRTSKSCTFGKGNRKPISQIVLRNAKEKPSPDKYNMEVFDEQTRKKTKGKTFGLSWNSYQKVYIDYRKDVYASFQNEDNPPAKYQVCEIPGWKKRKFSMYGRLKMYTQKLSDSKNWIPGARYSINDRHLGNEVGLHERSFGFGQRLDLSMPANDYPGSKYLIPGFCSKFTKIAQKCQKSTTQQLKIKA